MGRLGIGHERLGHDICIGMVWRRELELGRNFSSCFLHLLIIIHDMGCIDSSSPLCTQLAYVSRLERQDCFSVSPGTSLFAVATCCRPTCEPSLPYCKLDLTNSTASAAALFSSSGVVNFCCLVYTSSNTRRALAMHAPILPFASMQRSASEHARSESMSSSANFPSERPSLAPLEKHTHVPFDLLTLQS
jgi:hypothetical protein